MHCQSETYSIKKSLLKYSIPWFLGWNQVYVWWYISNNLVSQSRVWPASLRLLDNKQFVFGMSLKVEEKSKIHEIVNAAKKYFITEVMGFDPNKMTLCTILFEGTANEV